MYTVRVRPQMHKDCIPDPDLGSVVRRGNILNRDYSCFPVFIIATRAYKIYGHVCLTYAKFERITREITYFKITKISVICLFFNTP